MSRQDERDAGAGSGLEFGREYQGSNMVVSNLSRGARLSKVLGALGYDIKQTCFPNRRLVVCRETLAPEFDGDALACWHWLFETGKLADYVAERHRRQRMDAARCGKKSKTNQLRLFR